MSTSGAYPLETTMKAVTNHTNNQEDNNSLLIRKRDKRLHIYMEKVSLV